MSYVTWDIETTTRTSFKRKANPFDPENYVVMSGYKFKDGPVVGEYYGRAGAQGGRGLPEGWFTHLLEGAKVLVGANIKFDLLYALREPENLRAWMSWVAAGGTVWDIQLAEYLLNGMGKEEHMLSLDEMAPRYGGNVKFDEVKALWAAGVSTEDINPDLLRRYLCGDGDEHGDIGNTELVFLGQLARARATGQLRSIYLNMGSLLCTIEMERNGMAVDVQTGMTQAAALAERVAEVSVELAAYLPPDLPFDFNWNSPRQKSALIFGGTVPYEKRVPVLDEQGQQVYAQMEREHVVLADGGTMDRATWLNMYAFYGDDGHDEPAPEPVRFKGGKNAGEIKTKKVKVNDPSKPKSRMETFDYVFKRITEPKKQWAGAVPGVYSTAAEVIAELANRDIPFLEALGKVVALTKDLGTYYITTDPDTGESKGMLTLVQASGIIHHALNHTSTVTGRFSSSNPNLQNLPKGEKSEVKGLFVSRFPNGKVIQSDFTALEVYVQAILTKCDQLIKDLQAGLDMHCVRVSQKEGIPYEEAYRLCVVEAIAEWKTKRTKAKVFSFQRAYGAGAAKISESAKIPLEEVEALIKAEEERYPEVAAFYDQLTKDIASVAKVPDGRRPVYHPDIPGLVCYLKDGYWRTPDGKLYTWKQQPSPEYLARKGTAASFSPTEIKNYPVQGTGGEWAKAAMWLAVRAFYARGNFRGLALLVNQVHDALYADADEPVALAAAALLHACMEEASTFMEWYFDWDIPVPVPSDTTWGSSMLDEGKMPEGFNDLAKEYRAQIRADYIGGHTPTCEQQQPLAA